MPDQISKLPVILGRRQLVGVMGVSWPTIQRIPDFPAPFRPAGIKAMKWKTADVLSWIDRQADGAQEVHA